MGKFKKHYCPPQTGDQVMVMCPFGNANVGYIIHGVYAHDKEPITHTEKDRVTEYIKYKDDTKAEISLKDEHIKLETPNKIIIRVKNAKPIEIFAEGKITIESEKEIDLESSVKVSVKAPAVVVESPSIDLGATGGSPVITESCICPYTGNPHTNGSRVTRST